MASRFGPLLALAGVVAVGVAGWAFWTRFQDDPPRHLPGPDDDLDMLARITDARAAPAADRLAAASGEIVVGHGAAGLVDVRTSVDAAAPRVLARLGVPLSGLAIDDSAAWVTTAAGVQRLPFDGGSSAVLTDGLARPHAIATDGRWTVVVAVEPRSDGLLHASRIVSIETWTGAQHVLGQSEGEIAGVAVGAGVAYWADRLEGTLLSAPAGGGVPATILASDRGLPEQPTLAGDALVWVERRSESLWSIPRGGGTPTRLVQDFAGFAHVVACDGRIAWSTESAVEGSFQVLAIAVAGGDPAPVGEPTDGIDALACDGKDLLWMRDGVVDRVR